MSTPLSFSKLKRAPHRGRISAKTMNVRANSSADILSNALAWL